MKRTRVLIVGYGNIGRGVRHAIARNPDMELAGIVSRAPERVRKELGDAVAVMDLADSQAWLATLKPDIAILCGGSKRDLPGQGPELVKLLPTVDSFDNHREIPQYFDAVNQAARAAGHVAVVAAGWDPGIFSLERVMANAFLPGSHAYGFYGLTSEGGLSMGHSDALRTIDGVLDARQYTRAIPEAIDRVRKGANPDFLPGDMHLRECFVVAKPGADQEKIAKAIRSMPGYFASYETTVHFISQNELDEKYSGFPHDGCVVASGRTGERGNSAMIEYRCAWGSNPEATAHILIAHARAAMRLAAERKKGAFTILDFPVAYLSPHRHEELLKNWM